jgi:hypothetical protein
VNIYKVNDLFVIPEQEVHELLHAIGGSWESLYVPPGVYGDTPLGVVAKAFHKYRNNIPTGSPALCISTVLLCDEDLRFLRSIKEDDVDTTRLGRLLRYFHFRGM